MKSWFYSPLSTFAILVIAVSMLGACSESPSDGEQGTGGGIIENEITEPDSKGLEPDVEVVVEPVIVTVEASIEEGNAPLDVQLKCVATGAEPDELNYTFKVGSAPPTSLNELDFTFYEQGDYDVCCTAWRKDGKYTSEEACKLIRVKKAAELSITSPTVDGPAELAQGQCLNVSFIIANNGGRVDDPFAVDCVLSPYPSQNWADDPEKHITLKSWTVDSIKDGEFQTQKVAYENEELCIAEDVEDGQYFLLCKVDAKDEINEQNEGDNDRFATTFITIDHTLVLLPDLIIPTLELPQDQTFPKNWDDQLSYKLSLKNQGEAEASQFNYGVYLCDSEEFDDECFVINDSGSTIFSLKAGASIPISRGWPITPGMADGTYCLIVVVDTENSVAESNEENNQTTTPTCFEVKYEELAGIDLVVSGLKCSPKEAVWNGSFVVSFEVTNMGNTVSSPWDYKAVLNQQPTTNVFEPYKKLCDNKAACMNLAGLEPGAKVKVQETYIISKDLPLSEYYCMVHADSKKSVDETDETNNFATYGDKIKVLAKAYTDVFVADLSFTKQNTLAGKSIKLMYKMGNNNESSAAGVTVCAVLSADNKVSVAEINSGKDIVIGEKFYELVEPGAQNNFFEDEAKYVIPLALDHAVGEYFVGVVSDCKSVLKNDTVKTNDYAVAPNQLKVINPQGGCFEDEWEPNSAKELAVSLTEGLHDGLGLCNDEDWYSVLVPATNTLIVTVQRSEILSLDEVNPDIDVELVGPSGELIDVSVSTGQTDTVMAFVVPVEDTYFIRVKPKKAGNLAHYTIDIAMNEPFDGIDLFAAKATAFPTVTFSGGALNLNWTLVNLGSTPVGAFDAKVYFSTDETVDATDILVGSISIDQFAGATATVRSDSLVLPTSIAGGTYWVGIHADADDVVVEVDESNNWVTAAPIVVDGANPCIDTEDFEPNNSLETATELDLTGPDALASGIDYKDLGLCPDLDDWYKVELPEGKRFKATVNYLYNSTKGYLYTQLIDASGEAILDEGKLASKSEVLLPYVWQAGTYYLRVYNPKKSGKAKPYIYSMNISLSEPNAADVCLADQFEANNHPNQAQVVGCGLKEMTLCKKDQDFLKFDLPADGQVELTLNNPGAKMKLLVYEKIGGAIKHTIIGNNKKTIAAGAEGKTYWVQVTPTSTSGVVTSFDYTVFFDGIAGVDLQVDGVSPYTGQAYQGEDELVGFFVANQCLDTVNDVNFGMYLSDDEVVDENDVLVREAAVGKAIIGGESLGVNEKFTVPYETAPGKYKLIVMIDHDEQVVESNEGNNTSLAPFTVQEICVDDALEPNNHPLYPKDLMLGYYEDLQVCPYDLDWYRIALLEGDQLNIKVFFANGGGDLDMRLYEEGNFIQPILKAYKTSDGEALVYSVPVDGSYYLRVNGLSGAANAYSLFVSLGTINLCSTNPCQNGGQCVEQGTGDIICDCTDTGFEGESCELNVDDCKVDSCQNGGVCVDGVNSVTCDCPGTGFEGDTCEINIDDCKADSCQSGGVCVDGVNSVTCDCTGTGFEGDTCENNIDDCKADSCQNGGSCVDGVNSVSCDCSGTGFSGDACETEINECDAAPCQNSGVCTDGVNSFTCDCTGTGFEGDTCELNIDDCKADSCQNGGSCVDGVNSVSCDCSGTGFSGDACETEINECDAAPCQNSGVCTDGVNSFTCDCTGTGFEGDTCELNIDDCKADSCQNGGSCVDGVNSVSCDCSGTGFSGDACETEINECDAAPCQNSGVCTDGVNSFTCDCSGTGFSGDACEIEINECDAVPCQNSGVCIDDVNSYICDCTGTGFEGDTCENNIDDCKVDSCQNGGSCVDGVNSYTCDCTGTGFSGDSCETEINECDATPCQNSGVCTDGVNSFTCDCTGTGFTGTTCEEAEEASFNGCTKSTATDFTGTDPVVVQFDLSLGTWCGIVSAGTSFEFVSDFTAHPLAGGLDNIKDASSPVSTHVDGKFTLNDAGTYGFFCEIHSSMKGAIFVE